MTVGARIEALVDKADFLTLPEVAHLCAGGETPILRSHGEAVARFFDLKSRGMAGREQGVMGLLATCRQRAGNLLGVPADDIAFLSSASEGINQLASWLDWQPGDNVVVEDIEFPSGIYPWVRLRERGVEVRVVRQSGDTPTLERIAASMDDRTRILATSQVSYLTGRRYDLADLAALARSSAWTPRTRRGSSRSRPGTPTSWSAVATSSCCRSTARRSSIAIPRAWPT
jgi:cysteine desulfurase / selenocysteine lyase